MKSDYGGVFFDGDLQSLYSVNYFSRTAMYALIQICEITAKNDFSGISLVTLYKASINTS